MNAEVKKPTVADLLKVVTSGKATPEQQLELASLLSIQAKEQQQNELVGKFELLKKYVVELGLTKEQVIEAYSAPSEKIFEWTDSDTGITYTRFAGTLGRAPFIKVLKEKLKTQAEAEKFAIGEKGKTFIKNAYKPATATV
jgi:hypothetical protein